MSNNRSSLVRVVIIAAILATACGSDDTTTTDAVAATDSPNTTAASSTTAEPAGSKATTTTESPATTTSEAPTTTQPALENGIPLSDQPCVEQAAHVADGEAHEYQFGFNGETVPVGIRIGGPAALVPDSTIWVALHGAGGSWETPLIFLDDLISSSPPESTVVVAPQAQAGSRPFWTQSADFNAEYLDELFAVLDQSFCLEEAQVRLIGLGQGALALAQGVCSRDLPIDLAIQAFGMIKVLDCDPPRPVPFMSIDMYTFNPVFGNHWDGEWNPPNALEVELTGGSGATPDDLAYWADLYGCTDDVAEEPVSDPDDLLERDSVILTYTQCDAPLGAIGYANGDDNGPDNPAARDELRTAWDELVIRMVNEE